MQPTHPENVLDVHLVRSADQIAAIDALADRLTAAAQATAARPDAAGRVGLRGVVTTLKFSARPSLWGRLAGRAVDRAFAWNSHDQRDPVWWPQGITTAADSGTDPREDRWHGRRLAITTSYAKPVDGIERGARLTVLDLETLRYRHVLLVQAGTAEDGTATMTPVKIHAGGIVWSGDWVHVAATGKGFFSFHLDDVLRVPDDHHAPDTIGVCADGRMASFGHHHVLPARFVHRGVAGEGETLLRYSFLAIDRSSETPHLIVGEYGRGDRTTRLARYPMDPDTGLPLVDAEAVARPSSNGNGVRGMQGAVVVRGHLLLSVSRGPWLPGSLFSGAPGHLRHHLFAQPMGPEDLSYCAADDRIWSVSEHPGRRWVYSMPAARFVPDELAAPERGTRAS